MSLRLSMQSHPLWHGYALAGGLFLVGGVIGPVLTVVVMLSSMGSGEELAVEGPSALALPMLAAGLMNLVGTAMMVTALVVLILTVIRHAKGDEQASPGRSTLR